VDVDAALAAGTMDTDRAEHRNAHPRSDYDKEKTIKLWHLQEKTVYVRSRDHSDVDYTVLKKEGAIYVSVCFINYISQQTDIFSKTFPCLYNYD
jgi:hypothetical protein